MGIIPVFHAYSDPEDGSPGESRTPNEAWHLHSLREQVGALQTRVDRLTSEAREARALLAALILASDGHIAVPEEVLANVTDEHTVNVQEDAMRSLRHYYCKPPVGPRRA